MLSFKEQSNKDIKEFKDQVILSEARSKGEEMEEFIVAAINGDKEPVSKFGIPKGAGKPIANYLKRQGISGKSQVLGADTINVTREWAQHFEGGVPASTRTPKTDFIVGKSKISLKSGGAAQLMSGAKAETTATFHAAAKSLDNKALSNKLLRMITQLAPAGVASGQLGTVIKQGKDKVVMKANAIHKELQEELKSVFANNQKFANAFAYEAMSGDTKFGRQSPGSCTYFLNVAFDGKSANLKKVNDSSYVSKIAAQMKPSVRFKTGSQKVKGKKTGAYKYWSVVGLIVDKLNEDLQPLEGELLTEGILDKIRQIYQNVKNFIIEIFNKVKDFVSRSYTNLLEFLDIEPEVEVIDTVRTDI